MARIASVVAVVIALSGFFNIVCAVELNPPQHNAPIETIGLFKNGLAVVRRSATLPGGASVFDIVDLPEPVHGTFWVESTSEAKVTVTRAEVQAGDAPALPGIDNHSLAGSRVTVYFKHESLPVVKGTVAEPPDADERWDRNYGWSRPRDTYWWSGNWSHSNTLVPQASARALVLEHEGQQYLIDPESVAFLHVEERPEHRTESRPVLRLELAGPAPGEVSINILYLAKGASWAPSYSLDISESSQLTLRQQAVIRNELEDIADAEILLISGFPNIEFGHVLSPLAPAANLADFFRSLGTENRLSHASRGDVMSQSVMTNYPADRFDATPLDNPSLSGDDLYYHSIGRHTLQAGDSLMVNTARAAANYERIVQWTQEDDRDVWGRRRRANNNYNTQESMAGADPWDALRFRNPLDRPMTTAPAMIVKDGFVRGQSMLHWTSPGEMNAVKVNKALSVRAFVEEIELEDKRTPTKLHGNNYEKTTVEGTFTAVNQRAEPITLVACVQFSGELVTAEGEPEVELRPEGVWSVNPRRQMTWTLKLEPGESRELKYSYRVLALR